ncbi:hypothetical protein EAF04_006780 [Stromatinia cepivora]|nr:hypothetical protein EAF04_006780 [Stromatinia cepivora]
MSKLGPYCLWVSFKCSCSQGHQAVFYECPTVWKSKVSIACYDCDSVEIKVAHRVRVCMDCNRNEANGRNTSLEHALNKEATIIADAYFETFNNLRRWGLGPTGEGHEDIRINGKLVWIKKLQEGLTELERHQPDFVDLGSDETIVRPEFRFAGQATAFLCALGIPGLLDDHVSDIQDAKTEIQQKTAQAQVALEAKGFMVEGEFVKVADRRKNDSIMSEDYKAMVPDWDFLEVTDQPIEDLVTVVWKLKDGEPVQVSETKLGEVRQDQPWSNIKLRSRRRGAKHPKE